MPGSVNGGFNSKKKSWQTAKKQKAREIKKRKGAAEKHKAVAKSVSGARTKKHQKKVQHFAKLAGKEEAALESVMQVDDAAPATKQPAASTKRGPKQLKKQTLFKKRAAKSATRAPAKADATAADAEAMQE